MIKETLCCSKIDFCFKESNTKTKTHKSMNSFFCKINTGFVVFKKTTYLELKPFFLDMYVTFLFSINAFSEILWSLTKFQFSAGGNSPFNRQYQEMEKI